MVFTKRHQIAVIFMPKSFVCVMVHLQIFCFMADHTMAISLDNLSSLLFPFGRSEILLIEATHKLSVPRKAVPRPAQLSPARPSHTLPRKTKRWHAENLQFFNRRLKILPTGLDISFCSFKAAMAKQFTHNGQWNTPI